MADRRTSLQFDALLIEGALLLPDVVAKIASDEAGGSTAESYGIPPGLKLRDEIGQGLREYRAQPVDVGSALAIQVFARCGHLVLPRRERVIAGALAARWGTAWSS